MVEYSIEPLDLTFRALANPIRRAILARLTHSGRMTILAIAQHFDISLNGVSKHLKVLEQAGLIQRTIQGRTHYCSVNVGPLTDAEAWIAEQRQFWMARLLALEGFLEQKREAASKPEGEA
jgi:DNA-binding transcriptional ArsR family regulator